MHVPIGRGAERLVECAGMDDGLAAAAGQVRHRAAAALAEGGGKTAGLRQVEACDRCLAAQPAESRCLHDHLAGMSGPGRLAASRAVTVQEMVEGAVDLERNLAADAAPAERR